MDHRSFHEAVQAIAKGRHCATEVEATTSSTGRTSVTWKAYVQIEGANGWTDDHNTPEEALAELRGEGKPAPETSIEDIGDSPVAGA